MPVMNKPTTDRTAAEKRHPIAVASRRTGLSKDVLRVWESRYGVVEPGRTETGRRRYSDDDIERLRLLRLATLGGRSIGQIHDLPHEELEQIVKEDRAAVAERERAAAHAGLVEGLVKACLEAIEAVDADRLRALLGRAVIQVPIVVLTEDVLSPLLRRVGELWEAKGLRPGQEHLASVVLRDVLSDVLASIQPVGAAPRLLVATPAHHRHELGALLAAVVAASEGWHVTYLGPDLPAGDIADAAARSGARAVALSLVHPLEHPAVPEELQALRQGLGDGVAILVGGAAASTYDTTLAEIGARRVERVSDLRRILAGLVRRA